MEGHKIGDAVVYLGDNGMRLLVSRKSWKVDTDIFPEKISYEDLLKTVKRYNDDEKKMLNVLSRLTFPNEVVKKKKSALKP